MESMSGKRVVGEGRSEHHTAAILFNCKCKYSLFPSFNESLFYYFIFLCLQLLHCALFGNLVNFNQVPFSLEALPILDSL